MKNRCLARASDGQQCGRYAKRNPDGTPGQYCQVHASPTGRVAPKPVTPLTPEEILVKLMSDSDPAIRLRAVTSYLDRQDKKVWQCERCLHAERAAELRVLFLESLSETEFAEYSVIVERFKNDARAFRERIYEREPELRPDSEPKPLTPEERDVSHRAAIHEVLQDIKSQRPPEPVEPVEPRESAPAKLDSSMWKSVGIYLRDGIPSSDLGNEWAADVINGVIPYDDALRVMEDRNQQLHELGSAKQRGTLS